MALTAMMRAWSNKYQRHLARNNYRLVIEDNLLTDHTTSESDLNDYMPTHMGEQAPETDFEQSLYVQL